ncbi:MAG: M28 family peptidase [Anaerolineae bacterium]
MRNLRGWLRQNRIELILAAIFAAAVAWFGWLGYGVIRPPVPTPTPTPRATPTPTPRPPVFSGEVALTHAQAQCEIGPRPVGTEAHERTVEYIIDQLSEMGWSVERQEFTYRDTPLVNIIARRGDETESSVAVIGAHYDTRPAADKDPDVDKRNEPIVGANDGASGVAVLLELAYALEPSKLDRPVWLVFFDAEDLGNLDEGWPFSVGSSHFVESLPADLQIAYAIIVDMVGDADQQLYMETNSTPSLAKAIWETAAELGFQDVFIPEPKWSLIDDHTPFLKANIPAVDIIDFDYPYWHTLEDTCDKLSSESLERVGRTVETFLEERHWSPEAGDTTAQ